MADSRQLNDQSSLASQGASAMNLARSWPGTSYYQLEAGAEWADAGPLEDGAECDVAIIGGGLAGISTAVSLMERGVDSVRVLEADQPGAGASGRNGGFVFAGYSLANDALFAQLGREQATLMHGWTRDAVHLVRNRIDRYRIECQVNDAGVLLADWFHDDKRLRNFQRRMADQLDFRLAYIDRETMPTLVDSPRYGAGLMEPGSFHFHPLRHVRGLTQRLQQSGIRVHGQSPVTAILRSKGGWRLTSGQSDLLAREVVLTTGGYDKRLWPPLQSALQPIATYVAVTEPLDGLTAQLVPGNVAVYDTRFAFDYFRPLPDGRLLWGGRISIADRSPTAIRRLLRRDLGKVFSALGAIRFEQAWGGWMSYARHEMPLLGRTPEGLWHGLAFGGHGMATTTLAGEILAEAISGRSERLDAFERWQPVWAGGMLGRGVVQSKYWWLQLKDGLRSRFGRPANG
jgi:gamma-glutamylputrescine oxidase